MIINTNIMALTAQRNIKSVGVKNQKAASRLSGGFKINSGADDAAGLAISEKMRAQIRGLEQADRNLEDGMSLLQTADGGMDQISSMVIRARELMIQALNDTNSDDDKAKLQHEIDQLKEEIDARANNTEFNGIPLLNVEGGEWVTVTGDEQPLYAYKAYKSDSPLSSSNVRDLLSRLTLTSDDTQSMQSFIYSDGSVYSSVSFNIERYILDIEPDFVNFLQNELYNTDGTVNADNADTFANTIAQAMQRGFADNGVNFTFTGTYDANGYISFEIATNDASLNMGGCSAIPTDGFGHYYMHMGFSPDPDTIVDTGQTYIPTEMVWKSQAELWIQSGANDLQGLYISRYDCRTKTLGVDGVVVTPREAANKSLVALDNALNKLNTYRAKCGAQYNRLEYADASACVSFTSLKESLSRIADADMAKEMMEFTRTQALSNAGISMLAQANNSPETILQLLR